MSAAIPADAQRLADRLRMLADEVESAARYGVPVPTLMSVSGHEYGRATFAATEEEFPAWADYVADADPTREDYEHNGASWSRITVDVNGLPVEFAVRHAGVNV